MSTTLLPGDCPSAVEGVTVCPPSWAEDPEYQGMSSYFGGETPLSLTVGYLVVLGFGALFSVFTTLVVFLDKTFAGNASQTSEHFKWVYFLPSSLCIMYKYNAICRYIIAIEMLKCVMCNVHIMYYCYYDHCYLHDMICYNDMLTSHALSLTHHFSLITNTHHTMINHSL